MKAHIGVDANSGLVHTVMPTSANETDVEHVEELLHGMTGDALEGALFHLARGGPREPLWVRARSDQARE